MTTRQDQEHQTSQTLPEILAVVDNVIRLKKDTLGPSLLKDLQSELTRENPAYHQMKRMQHRNPYKYRFVKMPAATVSSYDENQDTVFIPRGFRKSLVNLAHANGQKIKFWDQTLRFDRNTEMRFGDAITLKKYQVRALSSLALNREGVIVAPCGGGKTITGIAAICTLGQPTIVLVHTTELMQQWQDELAKNAIIPGGVGQWGAGVKNRGFVTIAMIQTLIKMPPHEIKELLDNFGYVLLDEAHHCPADTFMAIMNLSKASYRHGLTATPERKDGLYFLAEDTLGPMLAEVTDKELEAEGRSQPCFVRPYHTTFYTTHTADEWTKLIAALVADGDRNRLIVRNIVQCWNEGHFPLVLSDRVGHCKMLCEALKAQGMNAQLMTGDVPKNIRRQIAERSRDGIVDCIVATKVADEGLDIPNLSAIHLTCPTGNEPKTKQRIGRIRRPLEGKGISVVYDYVDMRVKSCVRMSQERMRMYRKWGFSFEESK